MQKEPRTNASHKIKCRTIAARSPARKKPGTESAVVAAPRYCKKVGGRQMAVVGGQRSFVALGGKHRHTLLIRIRVEPDIRNFNTDL